MTGAIQQDYKSQIILGPQLVSRATIMNPTGWTAGTVLSAPNYQPHLLNQLVFYVAFTKNLLTHAEIKVEFSDDGVNYYQEAIEAPATSGVSDVSVAVRKLTESGTFRFAIEPKDKFIKISMRGIGESIVGTNNTITAILGVA